MDSHERDGKSASLHPALARGARLIAPFLAVLLVLPAACKDTTGPTNPVAAYALLSVDAKTLPATMYADTGYSVVVTAGAITLNPDKTYAGSITTRETVDGNASTYVDRAAGTWVQTGSAITLTPTAGPIQSATWSATRLTVTQSDGVYVYSRGP